MPKVDPTTPSPRDRKKMVVFVSPKMLDDLRIALANDNMTISELLRHVILGYLNGDTRIADFMKDTKKLLGRQSESSRKKVYDSYKKGQRVADNFELSEQDKKYLFDIFEEADKF